MLISEAQHELRVTYRRGSYGQAISSIVWATSAALATWGSFRLAAAALVLGGALIFPLTSLTLRLLGRPASLDRSNPFRALAIQSAFVLPFSMPLVAPVVAYNQALFFPAMMILLGAHYLPFATLYGMASFLVLGGVLVAGGVLIALSWPEVAPLGGWVAASALLVFAGIELKRASRGV